MSAPTSRGTGAQEAILTHAKALYKADKFKKSLAQFKLVSLIFLTLVGLLSARPTDMARCCETPQLTLSTLR